MTAGGLVGIQDEEPVPVMNETGLVIRDKLVHGELRGGTPETIWGGTGTGQNCSGCDWPITREEFEYEVDYPDTSAAMHFHQACLFIWDRYRRDYPSAGVA